MIIIPQLHLSLPCSLGKILCCLPLTSLFRTLSKYTLAHPLELVVRMRDFAEEGLPHDALQGSILAVVRSSETTIQSCGRVSKVTNSPGRRVSFKEPNLFLQFLTSQCTRVLNVHQPFSDSVL